MNVDRVPVLFIRTVPVDSNSLEEPPVKASPTSHLNYPCRCRKEAENREEKVID